MFKPPLTGEKLLRWSCTDHTREQAGVSFQCSDIQCSQCCIALGEELRWPQDFEELIKRASGSESSVVMAADAFRSMFDTTCPDFAPPDPHAQQKLQMIADNAHVAGDRLLKEKSQQLRLRKILIANKKKGFHSAVFGGMSGVPCYCSNWNAFRVQAELEAAFVEIAKSQHIYELENERMCKYVCDLFFESNQPDPDDLPRILIALQRRQELDDLRPSLTNTHNKVVTADNLMACAATDWWIHPQEMGRVWHNISEQTKLNAMDADIRSIASQIFGPERGHLAEEALRIIQLSLRDACPVGETYHAIGFCTALAGAPLVDDEVLAWATATHSVSAPYQGVLRKMYHEPVPIQISTGASVASSATYSVSAASRTREDMTLTEAPGARLQVMGVCADRQQDESLTMYQAEGDDGDTPPAGTCHDGGINIPAHMPKNREEAAIEQAKDDDTPRTTGRSSPQAATWATDATAQLAKPGTDMKYTHEGRSYKIEQGLQLPTAPLSVEASPGGQDRHGMSSAPALL